MKSFGPLPADQANTAQDTRAGAISVAEEQPIAVKSQRGPDTAREAFTKASHLSAAISALAAPAMAIGAALLLRRIAAKGTDSSKRDRTRNGPIIDHGRP